MFIRNKKKYYYPESRIYWEKYMNYLPYLALTVIIIGYISFCLFSVNVVSQAKEHTQAMEIELENYANDDYLFIVDGVPIGKPNSDTISQLVAKYELIIDKEGEKVLATYIQRNRSRTHVMPVILR